MIKKRMTKTRHLAANIVTASWAAVSVIWTFVSTPAARAEAPPSAPAVRITRTYFSKFFLSYTPDGSHLAYSRHYDNRRQEKKILMGLRIVKADGSGDRPLLPEFDASVQIQEHPSFSRDGKTLLLTGGGSDTGNSAKDTFLCDLSLDYRASHLRKLVPGDGVNVGEHPVWSPDGKEIVVTTTSHTLWIFDADGKGKRRLVQTAGQYCFQPAWSPDGEWITFSSDRDGNCEIYKIRVDGTDLSRLTTEPGIDCRPQWSPDAQWIAFTSNRTGNEDLFVMSADGSGIRNLTAHPSVDDYAAWSPDAKHLAFISMRDGGFDIYRTAVPEDLRVAKAAPAAKKREEPQGDLIAHYDFDADTGTVVRDRAGRNAMELFGAKLVGDKGHGALAFDGIDDYASCGNTRALQLTGPLTVSFWLSPDTVKGNGYVISKHGWNIYLGADFIPRLETRTGANDAWDTLSGDKPLPAAKWSFVAGVFDPEKKALSLYVNGQLAGTKRRTDGTLGATAAYPLELGCYNAARSQWLAGQLDELRIYKRALSAAELDAEYKSQSAKVNALHK